jgi:hypothetical protein
MQSNRDHRFIHPALTSFADECCATLARLIAYVGALALFAIAGLHFWDQLQLDGAADPANQPDFSEKSDSYEALQYPAAGCRDVFHWAAPSKGPAGKLFDRADVNRRGCEAATALPADWISGAGNPHLRGSL